MLKRRNFVTNSIVAFGFGFLDIQANAINLKNSNLETTERNLFLNSSTYFYIEGTDGNVPVVQIGSSILHEKNLISEKIPIEKDFLVYVPSNEKKLESNHILFFNRKENKHELLISKRDESGVYLVGRFDFLSATNIVSEGRNFNSQKEFNFVSYLYNSNENKYECVLLLQDKNNFYFVTLRKNENVFDLQWIQNKDDLGISNTENKINFFTTIYFTATEKLNLLVTNTDHLGYQFFKITSTQLDPFYGFQEGQILNSASQTPWTYTSWTSDNNQNITAGDVFLGIITPSLKVTSDAFKNKMLVNDFLLFVTRTGDIVAIEPTENDNSYVSLTDQFQRNTSYQMDAWTLSGIFCDENGFSVILIQEQQKLYLLTLQSSGSSFCYVIQEVKLSEKIKNILLKSNLISWKTSDLTQILENGSTQYVLHLFENLNTHTVLLSDLENYPVANFSEESALLTFRKNETAYQKISENTELVQLIRTLKLRTAHQHPLAIYSKLKNQIFLPALNEEENMQLHMINGGGGGKNPDDEKTSVVGDNEEDDILRTWTVVENPNDTPQMIEERERKRKAFQKARVNFEWEERKTRETLTNAFLEERTEEIEAFHQEQKKIKEYELRIQGRLLSLEELKKNTVPLQPSDLRDLYKRAATPALKAEILNSLTKPNNDISKFFTELRGSLSVEHIDIFGCSSPTFSNYYVIVLPDAKVPISLAIEILGETPTRIGFFDISKAYQAHIK